MLSAQTPTDQLEATALKVREHIIRMSTDGGCFVGASLSAADLIVYPELSDIQKAFPDLDPKLLGHDIAYPAMLKFLPVGWLGLMVGGLIAANSSTILTHLNWGASYLVHDFYRRFLNPGRSEHHYVTAGRLATVNAMPRNGRV